MIKLFTLAVFITLIISAGLPMPAAAQDPTGYEILYGPKQSSGGTRSASDMPSLTAPLSAAGVAGFDVLHYILDITIDPVAKTVAGHVDVTFAVVTAHLDSFELYLNDSTMVVTNVDL
jgi:hypothetical protein